MSLLIRRAISVLGKRQHHMLEQAAISPANAQRRFLLELLSRNAATIFGRQYGFASIRTEADYRRRVPIRDYEVFRPYINRMTGGESMVLTASQPVMFTMTSGTTAEPKLVPVTRESQLIESALTRQWFYRALLDHPEFMDHDGVGIVSRAVEGFTASGIPYGSASGMTYKNIPWLIRRVQADSLRGLRDSRLRSALFRDGSLCSGRECFVCRDGESRNSDTPGPDDRRAFFGTCAGHSRWRSRSDFVQAKKTVCPVTGPTETQFRTGSASWRNPASTRLASPTRLLADAQADRLLGRRKCGN